MRLKFRQDDIDVVIAVTNVHYYKHVDSEGDYKEGLSVLLQDVPQDIGMMFIGISKMDCNDIVEELLKYGYVDISDYDYTNILLRTQIKIIDHDLCF